MAGVKTNFVLVLDMHSDEGAGMLDLGTIGDMELMISATAVSFRFTNETSV